MFMWMFRLWHLRDWWNWTNAPADQPRDERSNHHEKFFTGDLKTREWYRDSFGPPAQGNGLRIDAEIETDRDMMKPVQQLAADIHETYLRLRARYPETIPPDLANTVVPAHFILYALARTASMNAKVSRRMEKLTCWIASFTVMLAILTLVLVLKELRVWPFCHV